MASVQWESLVGGLIILGFAVAMWGVLAVGLAAGISPFGLSVVSIPTPIGSVSTDDRQFAGGAVLVILGLIMIAFGVQLLRQARHAEP